MKLFPALFCLLVSLVLFSSCQTSRNSFVNGGWGSFASSGRTRVLEKAAAVSVKEEKQFLAESAVSVAAIAVHQAEPILLAPAGAGITALNQPENTAARVKPAASQSGKIASTPELLKPAQPREIHKLAIAGAAASVLAFLPFVLGISLLFGLPLALAGAFMSRRALKKIAADPENYRGTGLAKAGFGIAVVVLALLLLFGIAALTVG